MRDTRLNTVKEDEQLGTEGSKNSEAVDFDFKGNPRDNEDLPNYDQSVLRHGSQTNQLY